MGELVEFKDFSRPVRKIHFRVGQEEYDAIPAIPLGMVMELGGLVKNFGSVAAGEFDTKMDALYTFFDGLLQDDGGTRFRKQAQSKVDPLDPKQVIDVMHWLLEVYGLRPTEPSSDSSSGLSATGSSSTDGAQVEGSTHSSSESFESSTSLTTT